MPASGFVYDNATEIFSQIPEQYHPFYDVLVELFELHVTKSHDYGKEDDPYKNLRMSADFDIPAWLGVAIRMNDKMERIKTFAKTKNLKNESLRDAFRDIAVYAIIGLIFVDGTDLLHKFVKEGDK